MRVDAVKCFSTVMRVDTVIQVDGVKCFHTLMRFHFAKHIRKHTRMA